EAVLVEQLGGDVAQLGDRRQRGPRPARLVLGLGLAAHVELPGRQARGQTDVLSLLADGERELIVRDDHLHGVLVLVHDDARHLRGRQRAADVLRGIGGPVDDVDLLVAQLLHYRLHAGTPHADAGADRVDVAVVRRDGELGPAARLARRALHLDDAL